MAKNNEPFVLLDNGGETSDRYTLLCTKPIDREIQYIAFNREPFHPQGFGQHGSMPVSNFNEFKGNFRSMGRRIKLDDLPSDARPFADEFIEDCKNAL